ncbi:unnamed protein product [Phaeothamnion confervicola]
MEVSAWKAVQRLGTASTSLAWRLFGESSICWDGRNSEKVIPESKRYYSGSKGKVWGTVEEQVVRLLISGSKFATSAPPNRRFPVTAATTSFPPLSPYPLLPRRPCNRI